MASRSFKPTSPARRKMTVSDFSELTSKENAPERSLLEGRSAKAGRNNKGRITVRFRGGGHKRRYRIIDFKRSKIDVPARVLGVEYDPFRSARIALLQYADGVKTYILAPAGLKLGSQIISSAQADIQPGNCLPMRNIPLGTIVHAVEMKPGKGAQMVRSAGVGAQIMAREGGYISIRLPSGEVRKIPEECRATVGSVGNQDHENVKIGKAGRSRWLGRMPHNRGVTMNPVDHPHGGGEGRTSGGGHPRTPWGKPTKGYKTRNNKSTNKFIVSRRQSNRKRG